MPEGESGRAARPTERSSAGRLAALAGPLRIAASFAGFLAVWEIAVRQLEVKPYILPAPSQVLTDLVDRWWTVVDASLYTLQPMLVGFVAAVVVGVVLALIVAFSRPLQQVIYPLIVFLQIIPKIAVAPLFIIWFGYGLLPKVLLVFLLSFFPVLVAAVTAFRSVEPDIMDLARSTRANAVRIFLKVQLPHALPGLFSGFKVAAALSSTAAVVAEFVASDRGLGYLLLDYNANLNTSMTFAVILVLSLLGLALYALVELAERAAIPWHVSRRLDTTELPPP